MRRFALLVLPLLGVVLSACTHAQNNSGNNSNGTTTVANPYTGQTYQVRSNGQHAAAPTGRAVVSKDGVVHTLRFEQYTDSAENAFSVLLPQGWQANVATQRTTRIEPHYVIRAQSADGGVQMFFDDPQLAVREVPNRGTMMAGAREGQAMPSPWGGRLLIARYQPANQVAEGYTRARLCQNASDFRGGLVPSESQQLSQELNQDARGMGGQLHVDVGEVSFKCGDRAGYVYAVTLLASQPGQPVQMWFVYRLGGYLTTSQDAGQAAEAMHTMLESFQFNQQWLQRFAQESNDTAGAVIRQSNAVTQATIERAKQQDAEMESQYQHWKQNSDANFNAIEHTSNAITGANSTTSNGNGHNYNTQLGTKSVCDDLGRCQTVDASVDNWWSDCSGEFHAGSSTGEAPPASQSACWSKGH